MRYIDETGIPADVRFDSIAVGDCFRHNGKLVQKVDGENGRDLNTAALVGIGYAASDLVSPRLVDAVERLPGV